MATFTKSLLQQCASDIMSRTMVVIPRAMSLQGAARLLAGAGVSGAPVVDDSGQCIGVLSATDFMHWVEHEETPDAAAPPRDVSTAWQIPERASRVPCTHVEDCMTHNPVLTTPGTRIGELARMMMDAHIHRIIVVDPESQRPVGVVSSTDILAAVARADTCEPYPAMVGASMSDTMH